MNPLHYPDFTRCQELTKIGFPETEMYWNVDNAFIGDNNMYSINRKNSRSVQEKYSTDMYVCPSVSELLDVIPNDIKHLGKIWSFRMNKFFAWYVCDACEETIDCNTNNIASNLCDLIKWLISQGYRFEDGKLIK